jgi:hypothetical protein
MFRPIVFGLFRDIRNTGNTLHILQTKFHGHPQTQRRSVIQVEGLTAKMGSDSVRGWRAVARSSAIKVRVRLPGVIEIDGRLHVRPFRLQHRWVGAKQIIANPPLDAKIYAAALNNFTRLSISTALVSPITK